MNQDLFPVGIHADPHGAETIDGRKTVSAAQETADSGGTFGQGAEHDTSVRDGFIAGDGNLPA